MRSHPSAPGWLLPLALLLATALAGCSAEDESPPLPALVWDHEYSITTTPIEPFELQGAIHAAWAGPSMLLQVENEDDMAHEYRRVGGTWYTTSLGLGWTAHGDGFETSTSRAYRAIIWDLPGLMEDARVVAWDGLRLEVESTVVVQGVSDGLHITGTVQDGRLVQAVMETRFDVESPYTFRMLDVASAPIVRPGTSLDSGDVAPLEDDARAAHAQVIGWVQDYRDQRGALPETVDAGTLALQRLGTPWPENAFDHTALHDERASGHFRWQRCSDQDGQYVGFGWDSEVLGQSFGAGCRVV